MNTQSITFKYLDADLNEVANPLIFDQRIQEEISSMKDRFIMAMREATCPNHTGNEKCTMIFKATMVPPYQGIENCCCDRFKELIFNTPFL